MTAEQQKMPKPTDIQQQLTALRLEYASSLKQRVEQIIEDLNSLSSHADPVTSLNDMFRQIHSLSGSAASFGYSRLSESCRQLELTLKEDVNRQTLPDDKNTKFLKQGLNKLLGLIARGADDEQATRP